MKQICLDQGWQVARRLQGWELSEKTFVDLPHDGSISLDRRPDAPSGAAGGYFPGVDLIYEKTIATDPSWGGKRIWLTFEGIYQMATVHINGQMAGRQHYGYTTFHVDATPYLNWHKDNVIKVQSLNSAQPNSRWYSGSGIGRHVFLLILDPVDIEPWDLFCHTRELTPEKAVLSVQATITMTDQVEQNKDRPLMIRALLFDPVGKPVAETFQEINTSSGRHDVLFDLPIERPISWSVDRPALYTLKLMRKDSGGDWALLRELSCGLRHLELSREEGLKLNGQPIKLQGGCVHHDNGPLGARSYDRAEERKVRLLKEAGFNAVRCAHNPPAPAFLDACDRLGLLVIDEAFDCWLEGKNPYDYHMVFDRDFKKDLEAMVLRDRNHPSVMMWSTGNEIPERDGRNQGALWSARLAEIIRRHDPTRPITNALCGLSTDAVFSNLESNVKSEIEESDLWGERTRDFVKPLDVVGYNYMLERYENDAKRFPERIICGTESFPMQTAEIWRTISKMPHVIGDFVWTAFDYLGEAGIGHVWYDENQAFLGQYPWHQANCGDFDICGFPRPQLALRQCVWGVRKNPYLAVLRPDRDQTKANISAWGWPEVLPFWDWPEQTGQNVKVVVYGNAPEIRLSCNGRLIGSQSCTLEQGCQCTFEVPYEPGFLEAQAFDGETLVGQTILETPGPAAKIQLEAEKSGPWIAGGQDLAYIVVTLTDEKGRRVRRPTVPVTVAVSGNGRLLALGSGDPCSEEPYRGHTRRSYEGRLLAIVLSGEKPGDILVTAVSEGLKPAFLELKTIPF